MRVPDASGERVEQVESFSTTVRGLLTLHDWLAAHAVTQVAMEATGVYWKPVWAILEDDFDCLLVNARHVKQVPGRKTTSRTPPGCAGCSRRGCRSGASCLPSRSGRCAT